MPLSEHPIEPHSGGSMGQDCYTAASERRTQSHRSGGMAIVIPRSISTASSAMATFETVAVSGKNDTRLDSEMN